MAKKPKLKTRKLPPCGPVDVVAVWKRIETAVGALAPDLLGNLEAGATVKEINAFEKAIGRKLPEEVRQWHRAQGGQPRRDRRLFCGLTFYPLAEAERVWRMWADIEEDRDLNEQVIEMSTATPKNTITHGYANSKWIPLADVGGQGCFGVDFASGPKGIPGQVINFGRDEEYKVVLAWSWGWFLNDLAEELEGGNFCFSGDDDERGLVLINPAPAHGSLYNVMTPWSKAKLGKRRPFDPMSEEALAPLRADSNVQQLAKVIAENRDFGSLPILADALEEAGCTDKPFLAHCRNPGEHGCGCWAVNLLLGKAPEFVATK